MPSCLEGNFTGEDLYYVNKLRSDDKSWAWWLNHIGTLVIFIIGFFGNMLCLLVLCRRRLRRNSYTQYLIALAIVDTGAIFAEVLSALDELHQFEYKLTLISHTSVSCKLYNYIRYILYSMSSWIVVALAIERVVAIKFPLLSKNICTVVNARRIILIILLFTMFIQSYHLIIKGIDCSPSASSTRACRCKTKRTRTCLTIDMILTTYIWRLCLMTLLPAAIIITANILIMNQLFHEGSLVDHTNAMDNSQRKTKLVYKISRMLVIVTSIYLLLHVPGSSLDIFKYMYISVFQVCNVKRQYYIYVSHEIFDLLTNLNYGINFYLYIISGKHIRNELFRAIKYSSSSSKSSVQHSNHYHSSNMMSSYINHSRNNQTPYFSVPLSERRLSSCQQRTPMYEEH